MDLDSKEKSIATKSKKTYFLDLWEEISGILQNIFLDKKNNELVVELNFVTKIVIPLDADIEKKLNKWKGKKIGILRTDLPEKLYVLRYIK